MVSVDNRAHRLDSPPSHGFEAALVPENSPERRRDCGIDVGVGEDDVRRLATELHGVLHGSGAVANNCLATVVERAATSSHGRAERSFCYHPSARGASLIRRVERTLLQSRSGGQRSMTSTL